MTLHMAMVTVLRTAARECTPREISRMIADRDLYRRGDGTHALAGQISARANNYRHLFYKNAATGAWGLTEWPR